MKNIEQATSALKAHMIKSHDEINKANTLVNPTTDEQQTKRDNCVDQTCKAKLQQDKWQLEHMDTLIITALTVSDTNNDAHFSDEELNKAKIFIDNNYNNFKQKCSIPKNTNTEAKFFSCLNAFFKSYTK